MGAKRIQISPDDSTYNDLPGPSGTRSLNGEEITDTILGQSFQSTEAGLMDWSIDSTAYYKGFPGYKATIKRAGTSTSVTGESLSQLEGQTYMVDDFTKSLWSQDATVTVYDDGSDVTDQVDNINYLFGKVTFKDGYTVTGAITADFSYFPLEAIAKAGDITLSMTAETKNTTSRDEVQSNGGFRVYDMGLRTVSLELGSFYDASNDFFAELTGREQWIIEVNPDGNQKSVARGYFRLTSDELSGEVGALEEESLTFQLSVQDANQVPFDWYHATDTSLPQAIRDLLDTWEEQATCWTKYLPDGSSGWKGETVPTDLSLSSTMDGMNEFTATMQGTGELTTV